MSADNMYVILQDNDGWYSVYMTFASELEMFDHFQENPEEAEEWDWDYKSVEEMIRSGREFFRSQSFYEAYRWAMEQDSEYGVRVMCPFPDWGEDVSPEEKIRNLLMDLCQAWEELDNGLSRYEDKLETMKRERERLREALEAYADKDAWLDRGADWVFIPGDKETPPWEIAKKALWGGGIVNG